MRCSRRCQTRQPGLDRQSDTKRPAKASGLQLWKVCAILATSAIGLASAESGTETDDRHTTSADPQSIALFEAKIRPVLATHCYRCHSAQAGKAESGLQLDTREGIRAGGDRGAAVVAGKPEASLLLAAISHTDPDLKMPPKHDRLPAAVLADFRRWIRDGAADPRTGSARTASGIDFDAARRFWAYRKPVEPALPGVADAAWARQDIDRFILAKLEAAGLSPSPDAKPSSLLRRLYFDLTGLPPAPADLVRFARRVESDGTDRAIEAEVDALLASERFGEHWGRHWLDVARFGESSGKEANITFPYAWRYRDYVFDCFNADVPYDRFLVEQLAGDLLPFDSPAERARLLIATGFLALGPKNLDEMSPAQFRADVVDEQIDTVSRALLANSVACARCHDHKFDPFSMEDYYALAGIFSSTKAYFGTFITPANSVGGDPLVLPRIASIKIFHASIPESRVKALRDDLAALQREEDAGQAAVRQALEAGEDPTDRFTLTDALRIFWRRGTIEGELERVDEHGRALPLAMGVLDREPIADAPLLELGDVGKPRRRVPRRFPRIVELPDTPSIPSDHSGRLELSQWLTDANHPLTARVMANRVWHGLLGGGIVADVDNFGTTGSPPSHPELLDHLALRFVADGWSIKKLVRRIVLSRTYRQASTFNAAKFRADPENRLLWRASKRRLDAESIRDAMLVVAGQLDESRRAGSLVAELGDRPVSLIGLDKSVPADLDGSLHRSAYLPVLRDRLPDVLDLFDFAEPSLVTGHREATNVPLQALYLMNSPFVAARAEALAARLTRQCKTEPERIRRAFVLCYARLPEPDELTMAGAFLEQARELAPVDAPPRTSAFAMFCQGLLSTFEFRNLD